MRTSSSSSSSLSSLSASSLSLPCCGRTFPRLLLERSAELRGRAGCGVEFVFPFKKNHSCTKFQNLSYCTCAALIANFVFPDMPGCCFLKAFIDFEIPPRSGSSFPCRFSVDVPAWSSGVDLEVGGRLLEGGCVVPSAFAVRIFCTMAAISRSFSACHTCSVSRHDESLTYTTYSSSFELIFKRLLHLLLPLL